MLLESEEEPSIIKPIKAPETFIQTPSKDESPKGVDTPAFNVDRIQIVGKSAREDLKINLNFQKTIESAENKVEGPEPSFKEALLTYVLRREGVHNLFVDKFISCLESCEKEEFDAQEILIHEMMEYAKSRLTSIFSNDLSNREISIVLQNPDIFMDCFIKTNRVLQDQKGFLQAEIKDSIAKMEDAEGLYSKENEPVEPLVK